MAAANLGSLVATVAANTKPFQSGMKRANGMLSQLGQKLGMTDEQLKNCLLYTSPSPRDRG